MGILVNYFNPDGISLVREKIELNWASDSLLIEITQDSVPTISDTANISLDKSTSKNSSVKNNENEKIRDDKIVQTKDPSNENKPKVERVVAFTEPKAIKLEQAYTLFNKGITFVDARDESDYLAGHITNSINIPFDDFDNHKQKLDKLSKDKPLVLYCAGTDCDLSILLGNLLFEMGYKQVYVFFGGWVDWLNAKYPVEYPTE